MAQGTTFGKGEVDLCRAGWVKVEADKACVTLKRPEPGDNGACRLAGHG